MTATISAQDAITAVHEGAMLGGNDGFTLASLQAMTGLHGVALSDALDTAEYRGILAYDDGHWIACVICPTCGYSATDRGRAHTDPRMHSKPGMCRVHPDDRCAGYPIPEARR